VIYPSVDVYERIRHPLMIVVADRGFYAQRRDELQAVVAAAANRRLVDIIFNHNVVGAENPVHVP
jgi:hypothetical protein